MKKSIFIAAALSFFTLSAIQAQDAETPAKDRTEQRGRRGGANGIYESLNLSQEQKDKIKAFNEEQRKKMTAVREDASLSNDQKREKRMELMKAGRTQMESVLTTEQKQKLETLRKERAKERGNRSNGGRRQRSNQ